MNIITVQCMYGLDGGGFLRIHVVSPTPASEAPLACGEINGKRTLKRGSRGNRHVRRSLHAQLTRHGVNLDNTKGILQVLGIDGPRAAGPC